ncbi:ABC transporter ATP-binding protein [Chloroflexi bacterium TSY]|nr:ABC transporter ATP-binding protein [Chloroflexi bacterium TSY]
MEPILEAKELTKVYDSEGGSVQALRGIDLAILPGEFVAVMGSSGCGKSTLLHLLGGLDRPTTGEIYLVGDRIDTLNETQRAVLRRRQIGVVFQFFNLIGNLTAADNIELPALVAGFSAKEARRKRETLLDELGIADKADTVPSKLSGGEQQRVALARALINRPAVLLADEPTGNLNTLIANDVLKLLQEYNSQGQTILMVTHNARVASIADRVIYLRDGQIRDETQLEQKQDTRSVLSRLIQLEA